MATVFPNPSFNVERSAQDLRSAMKGFGTDEDTLIKVLCNHNNQQRQQIKEKYKNLFGRELMEDLESETGGKLEKLLVALLDPVPLFLAKELKRAMRGVGTKENTLIEILVPRTNQEIESIKQSYQNEYGKSLEDAIKGDTSGNLENLLVTLCQAARDESSRVDDGKVEEDARALEAAGKEQVGTNESTFNSIFCSRNFIHLRKTFNRFHEVAAMDIFSSIQKEMTGSLEEGYMELARYIVDPLEYFSNKIHDCLGGVGTEDEDLIRLVVSRSEHDLKKIAEKFRERNGRSLREAIDRDVSGNYQNALLAIVGNN